MRLFHASHSSASWRLRIAIALKGVPVDLVLVDMQRGEHLSGEHRARNPMGQVPVLQADGVDIPQSLAAILWLEATHPDPPLLPVHPAGRAYAWALAEMVNSGIQPLQNVRVVGRLEALGVDGWAWCRQWIGEGLDALESAASPARFLAGDEPTVADICLVPQLFNARRYELDMGRWPRLIEVEAACYDLDAFCESHPDRFVS
jgi:maleylacetoacetate isomerase